MFDFSNPYTGRAVCRLQKPAPTLKIPSSKPLHAEIYATIGFILRLDNIVLYFFLQLSANMSKTANRILVIRAGQLGDTVCASSIIEPLRHHYGHDVVIDWVAKAGIGQVFSRDSRIHRIFELKNRRLPFVFNPAKFRILRHSWQQPYDLIVNLELGSLFNDVMHLSRARQKIGMPYRYFAEPPEAHAVENLKLIYRSFLDDEDMALAEPSLRGTPLAELKKKYPLANDYLVLVPANSHLGKKNRPNYRAWPIEHWQTLIRKLDTAGMPAVIIGGRGEEAFFANLSPLPESVINLAGKTSFPDLVGIIAGARGVVSTDTGPAHIAAAVDTPVHALIGPTNFKRTGPYKTSSNRVEILSANLPCSPCYHTQRLLDCKKNICMEAIHPDRVFDAVMRLS